MLVSLTVGKVDAGVAVLLTEDKRLIEFPSILLPPSITTGSVVDVNVSRNQHAEEAAANAFDTLQSDILSTFGTASPQTPLLRCRNATQTSVVLEWDPIVLATANLRSLALYRNGAKAGNIPRPLEMTSTKISGLAVDTEYTFALVLRTSAGTYASEKLVVRTHKMTDLQGITVTPGIMAAPLRESLEKTIDSIGAKLIETIRIDTTHFVCTEGRGPAFEKAREMNIPVVLPDWVKGCEREGRLVGVRGYYLDANPKDRQIAQRPVSSRADTQGSAQQVQQGRPRSKTPENGGGDRPGVERTETPTTVVIPPTPERREHAVSEDDVSEREESKASEDEDPREGYTAAPSAEAPAQANEEDSEPSTPEITEPIVVADTNGDIPKTSVESMPDESSGPGSPESPIDGKAAVKKAGEEENFDEVTL